MAVTYPIVPSRGRRRTTRPVRRRMPMRRFPLMKSPIYSFKRRMLVGTLQLSNLTETFTSYTFKLSNLPNYTEFTNLFDRYRINKVSLTFVPNWDSNDANASAGVLAVNPSIYSMIDYTEDGTPLALNEFYENPKCKITRGGKIHKRYFTPAVLGSNFETVTTTAYTPKWKQWLTTDDPATPHYALKVACDKLNAGTAQNYYVKVFVTYYISCKDAK